MSRYHPYGGYDDARGGRRSASPGGPPRFSRYERGGGGGGRGGRGRGRGRGSFDNHYDSPYDGGYDAPPPHDAGYGGGGPDGYDDHTYEDGSGSRGRPPPAPAPPRRREKDDKVHDNLIEERIQRERPCRTLFIRNIKYETDSNDVRRRFEEHGEIKTFFDLIANRGMVFVTFYDLRAAERAKEKLQGSEISGRPIDVHYSLPRGDELTSRCDRDKNQGQGTLLVTLRDSPSGQQIDDNELRRKFQQFGDVKTVKMADRPDQRYVEMYDTRACEQIHDRLRHQGLQDGTMEIDFAWDMPDVPLPPGPIPSRHSDISERGGRDHHDDYRERAPRGRGGRGRGRGGHDDWDDYRDRERDRDRDRGRDRSRDRDDYAPPPRRGDRRGGGRGGWDDDYGRGGRGGRAGAGSYDDRYGGRDPPYGAGLSNDYTPYGGSNGVSAPSNLPPPVVDERLEQAKKVQQLLAALKGPQAGLPPSGPPAGAAPPPPIPPANPYANYSTPPPAPVGYPGMPPPPFYGSAPPPQALLSNQVPPPQSSAPPNHIPGGLPPAVLAMLQANPQYAQLQQQTQQMQAQQHVPPPHPGYPPPVPSAVNQVAAAAALQNPAAMQQLLSLLAQQQKRA